MNIMMIHYKVGGTDGVSLEMDKWKQTLEKIGHTVYMLGGQEGNQIVYPELYHITQIAKYFYSYSFQNKPVFKDENQFKENLDKEVLKCEKTIETFVLKNKIELVIVQNIWSVAMNIAVAIAIENIITKYNLKVLAQHHDFFWERKAGVHYGSSLSKEIAEKYLPPKNPSYKHVVINQQGHDTLLNKKNIESTIVPNVFYFNDKPWQKDSFNNDFKKELNINKDDILILQATRIVDRKAIELAIDLVAKMNSMKDRYINRTLYNGKIFTNKSTLVLLLAGSDIDDESLTYLSRLKDHALLKYVNLKIISDRVDHSRSFDEKKIYSLWDTYVFADLITYPSYWEGWGNQFLEGLFAKKPMIVYEYPVFITDIKNKGFDYISLGSSYKVNENNDLVYIEDEILTNAAENAYEYLFDKEKRELCVNNNFNLGKKYFSMESLYNMLSKILMTL